MRIDKQGQGASAVFDMPAGPTETAAFAPPGTSAPPGRAHSLVSTRDLRILGAHMAAIARGDEAALRALYAATVHRVYALALRILGDPEAAEEAVSDVYYQVWRNATRYDARRGNAVAYLMTICRSRALDLLRRRDRHLVYGDFEAGEAREGAVDPGELLQAVQDGGGVRAALATLTPLQRQVLALAFYRGLTHSEIAEHAAMPLGSVKTTIRRAILALRVAMEPGGER